MPNPLYEITEETKCNEAEEMEQLGIDDEDEYDDRVLDSFEFFEQGWKAIY